MKEIKTDRKLMEKEGIKDDAGKPRMDLIPAEVMLELGKLYAIGTEKYDDNNWRKGMKYGKLIAALERHLAKWKLGEEFDPDGQHHLDSVIWNAIALRYYQMYPERYNQNDDRYIAEREKDTALQDTKDDPEEPFDEPYYKFNIGELIRVASAVIGQIVARYTYRGLNRYIVRTDVAQFLTFAEPELEHAVVVYDQAESFTACDKRLDDVAKCETAFKPEGDTRDQPDGFFS